MGAGVVLDRVLGDPPDTWHPVAWFGSAMERLETRLWADDRRAGIRYAAAGVGLGAGAGLLAGRAPGLRHLALSVIVSVVVAGRGLREAASVVEGDLLAGDLAAARADLRALAGRDASTLDDRGVSAAVVESLAENSVDAVVAPVFWALVAGAPGAATYRAVNTMDAMVGNRSRRYRRFGWAAARLDDVAGYVPARLYVGLVAIVRPRRAAAVLRVVRRDARAHPSPNAGVAESAGAGALDRQVGGPLRYRDDVENRPVLGTGPRPRPSDIARARALADDVDLALAALLVIAGGWARRRSAGSRPGIRR